MTLPPPRVCRRIHALHGMLGSPNANEANNAREKLTKLLVEFGLTWNDLPAILAALTAAEASNTASTAPPAAGSDKAEVNVFDLVRRLVEDHVAISSPECTAGALWILHCWLFDRFEFTPRLALLSPVRGCGKSTFLRLIELLTPEPCRTDNATAAAIYHLLDRRPHTTLLIDEGDNLNLANNPVLRVVFNSGHQRGGSIRRYIGGWSRELPTFAPLAVPAIGTLPLPFMHRSIRINMQRATPTVGLKRLDAQDPVWAASRDQIRKWATTCQLQPDPTMPGALFNRGADNFRVLFAIADDLGAGEEARAAALEISANHQDEDVPARYSEGALRTRRRPTSPPRP